MPENKSDLSENKEKSNEKAGESFSFLGLLQNGDKWNTGRLNEEFNTAVRNLPRIEISADNASRSGKANESKAEQTKPTNDSAKEPAANTDRDGRVVRFGITEIAYEDKSLSEINSIKLPSGERFDKRDGMVFRVDKNGEIKEKMTDLNGKILATGAGFEIVEATGKPVSDHSISGLSENVDWQLQRLKEKMDMADKPTFVSAVNDAQRVVKHDGASFTYDAKDPAKLKGVSIKDEEGKTIAYETKAGGVIVFSQNGNPVKTLTDLNGSIRPTAAGVEIVDGNGKGMLLLSIGSLRDNFAWQAQMIRDSRPEKK